MINARIAIMLMIITLTIGFIWSNSSKSIPESQYESQSVLRVIKPMLEVFVGEGNVTENLVRKLAHFSEYALLGMELILLLLVGQRTSIQNAANCLFLSLIVAVIDETIQVYSNRGSQVIDVILDFSGASLGVLLTMAVFSATKRNEKPNSKR